MINTSYSSGLVNYFNSDTTSDLFTLLSKRSGLATSGASGSKTTLTLDTVNKMTDPEQKIIYAGQIANTLKLSSDAAVRSGNPTRMKDITAQAQKIMTTINDAVTTLQAKDTKAKTGQANAGVKTCQEQIDTALTTLHSILTSVGALADKAADTKSLADTAAAVKTTMRELDSTACTIAKLAGTGWKSLFKNGTSAVGTSTSSISSLIDMLA